MNQMDEYGGREDVDYHHEDDYNNKHTYEVHVENECMDYQQRDNGGGGGKEYNNRGRDNQRQGGGEQRGNNSNSNSGDRQGQRSYHRRQTSVDKHSLGQPSTHDGSSSYKGSPDNR